MAVNPNTVGLIVALLTLLFYLYGMLVSITTIESNDCKMTYMFEYPQFVKINFRDNEKFPKYNLFAYSEGRLTESARDMKFSGAPVIYVPGNAGSYKQVRSLASVALRKGLDENWARHLDYFTVDYDEEYSALFGGVLDDQRIYLELCITTVLNLYKDVPNAPTTVTIVAHSMGGIVAQSVLMNRETASRVSSLVAIAAPIDKPVVNIDFYMEAFYRKANQFWLEHRPPTAQPISNLTNMCCVASNHAVTYGNASTVPPANDTARYSGQKYFLRDLLLVTIGGGSRDILVRSGLTQSQFSDVHAMSTCIPGVWLTTDHLASVWCLQQVMAINRFLYGTIEPRPTRQRALANRFIEDKAVRLASAKRFLSQETSAPEQARHVQLVKSPNEAGDWVEDNRRIFSTFFRYGLNKTYVQMIRLHRSEHYEILNVEALNIETNDWVFGCAANEVAGNHRYCATGQSLTHYVRKIPSKQFGRKVLTLDLFKIQDDYPQWTHIILAILPTKEPVKLNIDIHAAQDRQFSYSMPSWYSYSTSTIIKDTIPGANKYRINFNGLDESYQAIELQVEAKQCSKAKHHAVAKVCVPWTRGFDRYHYFTQDEPTPFYIHAPTMRPAGYNTTLFPLAVDLYLDPGCQYEIRAKNALGQTASRIFLQHTHWLPAHFVAILLLAFRHQIQISPDKEIFKCGPLTTSFFASQTFFIITASRLCVHLIQWSKTLPDPDHFKHSVIISIIVHGSALAILNLATYGLWVGIALCGNVAYQFLYKLTQWPISLGVVLPAIQKFPVTVGVLLVSMACASCGGIALISAVIIYFILIAKMYEDYLEEYVFKTAAMITQKLFGKKGDAVAPGAADAAKGPPTLSSILGPKPQSTAQSTPQSTPAAQSTPPEVQEPLVYGAEKASEPTAPVDESSTVILGAKKEEAGGTVRQRKSGKKKRKEEKPATETGDKDDEPTASTSATKMVKFDLNVQEHGDGAVAVAEPDESFEDLYEKLDPEDVAIFSRTDEVEEMDEEKRKEIAAKEAELDAELDKLIASMMEKQKEEDEKRNVAVKAARKDYDAVQDGMSAIHFHMTMFLLLCILALVNLPSVFVWAKNFSYGEKVLQHDPSYFPAIASIISLSVIWQLPTPRSVHGYEPLTSLCYVMAMISVLYAQDSLYRLNAIITSVFVIISLQQAFMPKLLIKNTPKEENVIDTDLLDRVRRLRDDMSTSGLKSLQNDGDDGCDQTKADECSADSAPLIS